MIPQKLTTDEIRIAIQFIFPFDKRSYFRVIRNDKVMMQLCDIINEAAKSEE